MTELLIWSSTFCSVSLSERVICVPLIEKVWPATELSSSTLSMFSLAAGGAVSLESLKLPLGLPLRSTVVLASCVMLMSVVPGVALVDTVALPTAVFDEVAVWVLKRPGAPRFCNARLTCPRLVLSALSAVFWLVRFVSSVCRLVMGTLSAAMSVEMIDDTFRPL